MENENVNMKNRYDFIKLNFEAEKDKIQKNHENKVQALKDLHTNEMKLLNENLSYQNYQFQMKGNYKMLISNCKSVIRLDLFLEENLNESLQIMQNKAALEYDLMESRLKKSLDDANIKLRELNNANSTLRSEIFSLKTRFSLTDYEDSKKVHIINYIFISKF